MNDLDDIETAQAAAQGPAPELVHRQEVYVLNKLVRAYDSGELTPQDAIVGVGVITEMRRLRRKMLRAVLKGDEAALNVTGATPNA